MQRIHPERSAVQLAGRSIAAPHGTQVRQSVWHATARPWLYLPNKPGDNLRNLSLYASASVRRRRRHQRCGFLLFPRSRWQLSSVPRGQTLFLVKDETNDEGFPTNNPPPSPRSDSSLCLSPHTPPCLLAHRGPTQHVAATAATAASANFQRTLKSPYCG